MRIITKAALVAFGSRPEYKDAEHQLKERYKQVTERELSTIRSRYAILDL